MPLTDPAMILALSAIISTVIAGLGSWYVMRNAAKKDALQMAEEQIDRHVIRIGSLGKEIETLRKDYNELWRTLRMERDAWERERVELKAAICDLQEENRILSNKIGGEVSR
jgi:cytochrome oxidase assembly protein ShyY1